MAGILNGNGVDIMAKIHEILDSFVLYIFSCYLQFGIVCHGCLLSALKVRNERVRCFFYFS